MITALLIVSGVISAFLLGVGSSIIKSLIDGEIRGALSDRLRAKVHAAVELLPDDISADLEADWLAELDAARDRPRLALRFVRGLPDAARSIATSGEKSSQRDWSLAGRPPHDSLPPPATPVKLVRERVPRAHVSIASTVGPLVTSVVMIGVTGNPQYAIFMLLTPVIAVGTYFEARRRIVRGGTWPRSRPEA